MPPRTPRTSFRKHLAAALGAPLLAVLGVPAAGAAEPIWDANKVEMTRVELGEGAYAFYPRDAAELNGKGGAAATSGGLLVGKNGALLIETMLNKRLLDQILQLAAAATPKKILYAVNTSFHGDHSYGNMYLPAGVQVVQHEKTQDYVAAHLADDKAFMIQNFGAGRGIEEIVARRGDLLVKSGATLTLDLGDRQVDLIDFGFAQTGGDLFVWDRRSKVMWAGNPIIAAAPSLPWLLDGHLLETLATLEKVHAFLPPDARIVPGHGVAIGREQIAWHIDYLKAVRDEVAKALAAGLTLEQTVAKAALPQFRGYVLFDWVHPALNVPAAYQDLARRREP